MVIHEAGHALFARLIGNRVTSFGLGTGRPYFRTSFPGGTIFFLCRDNPTLGTCWTTTTELFPSRLPRALLLIGGGIVNLLAAALCLALTRFSPGVVWLALAIMNALVGLANLLPFRQRMAGSRKAVASDGLQAVSLLLSRHARAEVPQAELGFRALWEEICDTQTLRYRLFRAALAAQERGAHAEAARYAGEAESLPGDDTDAHLTYLRGRIALEKNDLTGAYQLLRVARYRYVFHRAPGSVFLCDLHLSLAAPPGTNESTDELASSLLARRADGATKLAATRLLQFTGDTGTSGDIATLETLLARYESARRNYRADPEEVAVYEAVAAWRGRNGDAAGAALAREQAERLGIRE